MTSMSGPYIAHGVTLALAWFLGVNIVACAVAALGARLLSRRAIDSPAFWLAARLFPALVATAFVLLFFVPSYWKYEPRVLVEGFDLTLTALAAGALVTIAAGLARGATAWHSASQRTADWMRHASAIQLPNVPLRTYLVDASRPMMALAGVVEPRLLVTRGLLDALTPSELAASAAHELSHHRTRDNLKRLLMRAVPDLLGYLAAAREIEERWAAAAERAADRRAAGADRANRYTLASALVKVARLTPAPLPVTEPISLLVSDADITSRVHVLLTDAPPAGRSRYRLLAWIAGGVCLLPLAASYAPLLRTVHEITELLVHSLP
jgi:hypothetical protein